MEGPLSNQLSSVEIMVRHAKLPTDFLLKASATEFALPGMSSIKTTTNSSKYGLKTLFIKSMNAAGALLLPLDSPSRDGLSRHIRSRLLSPSDKPRDASSSPPHTRLAVEALGALEEVELHVGHPSVRPGLFTWVTKLTYNLSNLEALLLRQNQLNGTLPMEGLTSFCHLEIIDLSENNFFASLCKLKKLEELALSHNLFEGILPSCLSNLRSLKFFDISLNQFTGNISPSLFGSLNSPEYIGHNRFKGLFSFGSFANHSNLEVVELISGNDKFEVETEYTYWIPMFQLKVLVLSNCNLNKLSGNVIDLSHSNLAGSFTNWLLVNNTRLEVLNLRNNSFVGQFCLPSYRYINTYWIGVSNNLLSGKIQAKIWADLKGRPENGINLSRNAFEGGIPSSFGMMSELVVLDLSINNFLGEVPNQLIKNCRYLGILKLSNNNFCGQIFLVVTNLTRIWHLQLNDNQFTGPLTNVLSNLSNLNFLDISNKYMSGKITSSMDSMTSLETLIL
ncbi:hypothetical protein HYC85_027732 [Camellia sinensis]|uniref:Uncharacterized protein n=1 Tax=Camellia sinensis TaxID=4442 RepID=A0A7J7FU69_CAMSI|nr:hypothetical protein HYC85_027732 [Camellia sinensis]